jgi:hypothetical protein
MTMTNGLRASLFGNAQRLEPLAMPCWRREEGRTTTVEEERQCFATRLLHTQYPAGMPELGGKVDCDFEDDFQGRLIAR